MLPLQGFLLTKFIVVDHVILKKLVLSNEMKEIFKKCVIFLPVMFPYAVDICFGLLLSSS